MVPVASGAIDRSAIAVLVFETRGRPEEQGTLTRMTPAKAAAFAATTLVLAVARPAVARPSAPAGCQSGWTVVGTPRTIHDLSFTGVTAVSKDAAWAVGGQGSSVNRALIERWNGAKWQVASIPDVEVSTLTGVDAVSDADVWAAGPYSAASSGPVVEHWDGSTWSLAAVPSVIGNLTGVTATAANDAWAAGYILSDPDRTLVEHWDGRAWTVSTSPNVGHWDNQLLAVDGTSSADAWAVGWRTDDQGGARTLVERWDGSGWTAVPSPNLGSHTYLRAVAAMSPTDVWAGGDAVVGSRLVPLIEHWDGIDWSVVSSPNPDPTKSSLILGMSDGAGGVWAVGNVTQSGDPKSVGFTERWTGSAWKLVDAPDSGSVATEFRAAATSPDGDAWVVGLSKNAAAPSRTLTERICR
jgi:hypothetical protein